MLVTKLAIAIDPYKVRLRNTAPHPMIPIKVISFSLIGTMSLICCPIFDEAKASPAATSNSSATSAGTTVNNQNNSQINTSSFYGFGPGINCPTTTLSIAGFGGTGSGVSNGDLIGARVNSDNYGGVVTLTIPIGGANAKICKMIGEAQVLALQSQVERAQAEARKTQSDINLVTALKCVEILNLATLTGQFGSICKGINVRQSQMIRPVVRNQ